MWHVYRVMLYLSALLRHIALLLFLPSLGFAQTAAPEAKPTVDPAAAIKRMKDLGDNRFQLGDIEFNSKTREVRIPCAINMQEGQIEFALVHETGKTHESILKTAASPVDVQIAMLLCNFEPGHNGLFDHETDPKVKKNLEETQTKTPGANQVQLRVEWDKGQQKADLRDWILDGSTKKAPTDFEHWIFNGSMVQESGFSAALHGNLIGIYYDVCGIINCPSPRNRNDELWMVLKTLVPAVDTPVTLIISPKAKP